jgi:DNA adenine methylase
MAIKNKLIRPFLRWAGGKQRLTKALIQFIPEQKHYERYIEPFIGGGAIFFAVQPKQAEISDINVELINCYKSVARNPQKISNLLEDYSKKEARTLYYSIRNQPLEGLTPDERAARFIFLNKSAFNGIYRENKNGRFNVPYGPSSNGPAIPTAERLLQAASCLRNAKMLVGDFEKFTEKARKGDFIYFDPPYPPRSKTACFNHYSKNRFTWEEQVRVADTFLKLSKRGCLVMLSNADKKEIRQLYKDFNIARLNAVRWLGSNGDRFGVREIVVTNYDPNRFNKSMPKSNTFQIIKNQIFVKKTAAMGGD